MRVGQNPAKFVDDVPQPAAVTVAVISYIPFLGGYYEQSLDVLKLCLQSIWDNTEAEYDLLVFDNASCAEVRQYLLDAQEQGRIQYLTLSDTNVGKAGAWNYIFGAAPGEYIAYADSDVYFYPGWLNAQLAALKALPQTGMVTGLPMLTPAKYSTATLAWAESHSDQVTIERGRFLPWEDFWRHASSLGGHEEKARQFYQDNEDICLLHEGQRYYVGAAHFQFVAPKKVLQAVAPIPSRRPMGEVRLLDEAINAQGYLRLCVDQWYAQHIGNTVPSDDFFIGKIPAANAPAQAKSARRPLWLRGPLRRLLQWVYDRSFELLYKR